MLTPLCSTAAMSVTFPFACCARKCCHPGLWQRWVRLVEQKALLNSQAGCFNILPPASFALRLLLLGAALLVPGSGRQILRPLKPELEPGAAVSALSIPTCWLAASSPRACDHASPSSAFLHNNIHAMYPRRDTNKLQPISVLPSHQWVGRVSSFSPADSQIAAFSWHCWCLLI